MARKKLIFLKFVFIFTGYFASEILYEARRNRNSLTILITANSP